MKAKSIKEMTLEMLKSAINDNNNSNEEMLVLVAESMQKFYYRWYIETEYIKFKNGGDAREILSEIGRELKGRVYNFLCVTVGNTIETLLAK